MAEAIELTLERPSVVVGETIRGQLLFLDDDPRFAKCKQVRLECRARAHGSGTTEYVLSGEPLIRQGAVTVPLRLPFEFRIPEKGPVSYEGRYVKISWEVHVTLDIPWATDPSRTVGFTVRPKTAVRVPDDAPVLSDVIG